MTVYKNGIVNIVLGLAFAGFCFLFGVWWFLGALYKDEWWLVVAALVVVWVGYKAALASGNSPHQILQADDGSLVFIKVFGRITVYPSDIQAIEVVGHGEDDWTLVITHTGGRVKMLGISQTREFISTLTMLNPAIIIKGEEWFAH